MNGTRMLAAVIAVSLAAPLAPAAIAQDITVTAPRHGKRSSTTGAPIETVSHSVVVSTAGLDLSTPGGMAEAEKRIRAAAQSSCSWLDRNYASLTDDAGSCVKAASDEALARARAIAVASR